MSPQEIKIIDLMLEKNKFLLMTRGVKTTNAMVDSLYEAFKEYAEYKVNQSKSVNEIYDKAVTYVQETYFDGTTGPAVMLGNVAELIELVTNRSVDLSVLQNYSK